MKKSLTSLAVREMQVKTTLRFHFAPVRWQSSRKQTTNAGKDVGKKAILIHC
jgi:hypothetical protein